VCSSDLNPLRYQHAKDIVVWHHKQLRRIGKGGVIDKPLRITMPMRAEDRRGCDGLVYFTGNPAGCRIGGKLAVRV